MKQKGGIALVLLLLFGCSGACAQKNYDKMLVKSDSDKIDSTFNHYCVTLELFLKHPEYDSSGRSMAITAALYDITGIISTGKVKYHGWDGFTAQDIEKWRAWYSQNKGDLIWDRKTNSIVRKK